MSNSAGRGVKPLLAAFLLLVVAFGVASEARAQVGHPPESSPYTDVRATKIISLGVGYLGGSAGSAGVGPTDGPLAVGRFNMMISGPLELDGSLGVANLERGIIDPTTAPTDSIVDVAKQTVTLLDAGIMLLLTGRKAWHRTIPYLGASFGVAFGGSVPEDTLSGFRFKTQFQLAPVVGVRWYPSDRLMFRLEFRDIVWRLTYPPSFFTIPEDDILAPPVLNPNVYNDTEWTHHPTLLFTIGYAITL